MTQELRVGMIAGEKSGDNLGAGFIKEMQRRFPNARFEGIGGPAMQELGFHSLFPMDRLSVMGFIEPLARLPELLSIDRQLKAHFVQNPPDVFVGIDSPGFNTRFESYLRSRGIRTVHYVSPSVWAYGEKRIHKIKRAVDLMLVLFPFETAIYQVHDVPVTCVGHPLADDLATDYDQATARSAFGIEDDRILVALLPGSRMNEVRRLAPVFFAAASQCLAPGKPLSFVVPCASPELRAYMEGLLGPAEGKSPFLFIDGNSQNAIRAADFVFLASGTATLETMLLKKPMVICYKLASLTYLLASRLLKIPFVGLPNLLAGEKLVPEYIQDEATPGKLAWELQRFMANPETWNSRLARFEQIHRELARQASSKAADAVAGLLQAG